MTTHETDEHRRLQRDTFDRLEPIWKVRIWETQLFSPLDAIAVSENEHVIKAVIEHKTRSEQYETHWLLVRKYMHLIIAADTMKVRPLYVMRYPTPAEIWWIDVREIPQPLISVMGGRPDRPEQPHEPMLVIPKKAMHKVKL